MTKGPPWETDAQRSERESAERLQRSLAEQSGKTGYRMFGGARWTAPQDLGPPARISSRWELEQEAAEQAAYLEEAFTGTKPPATGPRVVTPPKPRSHHRLVRR